MEVTGDLFSLQSAVEASNALLCLTYSGWTCGPPVLLIKGMEEFTASN